MKLSEVSECQKRSFHALIIQVLRQVYYIFLYFEFRWLICFDSEHLKFPFYVVNHRGTSATCSSL